MGSRRKTQCCYSCWTRNDCEVARLTKTPCAVKANSEECGLEVKTRVCPALGCRRFKRRIRSKGQAVMFGGK